MFKVTFKNNVEERGTVNGFSYIIEKWIDCELKDGSRADVYIVALSLREHNCFPQEGEDIWHQDFLCEVTARNWLFEMTK